MHDLLVERRGVRKVILDDIPWMLSLAYERYGPYDPGGALRFLLGAHKSPDVLMLRTENAFMIASIAIPPWLPKSAECNLLALCAKPGAHWQAVKLLRESVIWARLRGCVRWRFNSETEHDVGALAKRVGAREDRPRYVIDL